MDLPKVIDLRPVTCMTNTNAPIPPINNNYNITKDRHGNAIHAAP